MSKIRNVAVTAMTCLILMLSTIAQTQADSTLDAPSGYQAPADTAGLQIVELLPHSPSCSLTDTSLLCNDYVKLFNSADAPVDLANYRLRTSYGGLNSSSRNTFSIEGSLEPDQYSLINTRNDGSPLSLTDSGGYIWLEDAYGTQAYDPVVEYPDAGADNKIGQAWAYDGDEWQWTSSPQSDGPNSFPLPAITEPIVSESSSSSLKTCAPDQYRNPTTNRCRKVSASTKTLKPCRSDQVRNPVTNRCRSIKTATKTLKPCKPGQVRNLATNRCRSILTATKTKKPCKPSQERNPDTGRCRKIQPKITPVHDIKTASKTSGQHWYLVAAISAGAVAYVLYEWRQEISTRGDRLKTRLRFLGGQNARNLIK